MKRVRQITGWALVATCFVGGLVGMACNWQIVGYAIGLLILFGVGVFLIQHDEEE